jgi:hypothetical protein
MDGYKAKIYTTARSTSVSDRSICGNANDAKWGIYILMDSQDTRKVSDSFQINYKLLCNSWRYLLNIKGYKLLRQGITCSEMAIIGKTSI